MTTEHLNQIGIELERRSRLYCGDNFALATDNNPGLHYLERSVVLISDLCSEFGDVEMCIPESSKTKHDNINLFVDLIDYHSQYLWYKVHYIKLPSGKILLEGLIKEMEVALGGRLEGRQPWHVVRNKK